MEAKMEALTAQVNELTKGLEAHAKLLETPKEEWDKLFKIEKTRKKLTSEDVPC